MITLIKALLSLMSLVSLSEAGTEEDFPWVRPGGAEEAVPHCGTDTEDCNC